MTSGGQAIDRGLAARLRLARTARVGPRAYRELMRRFGSAEAALEALPGLRRGGGATVPPPENDIVREMRALEAMGGRFIGIEEAAYPALLARIHSPPGTLAALGDTGLLQRPAIAVVGARNASASGRGLAERFAAGLGRAGFVIVSGLARGIDAAAHGGAVETGTIAVMAGGVDHVYPPQNAGLYREIVERGLVLGEQPMGMVPRRALFPRRNRIVAGLCRAVLVIEATSTSGALITARLAADEGREVFAVPGSPLEPRSRGCNRLIRDGAMLAESADDIVEALAIELDAIPRGRAEVHGETGDPGPEPRPEGGGEAAADRLLAALGTVPVDVDELVRRCQVTAAEVQTLLVELELAGRVERHPGNKVSLIPD